jgi:ribose transport system permease protein
MRVLPSAISAQERVLIAVIGALWILLGAFTPAFFSAGSIQNLLWRVTPVGIIAVGMTMVIITAGIDSSVAAYLMVCSVVVAKLITQGGLGYWQAVPIAILVGGFLGALNGVLVAYGRVPAMIITFGTANLFQFIGLRIFNSQTVNGLPAVREVLGPGPHGRTFGVPHAFIVLAVVVVGVWLFLRHFPAGRHLYAVGDNPGGAALAGINVRGLTFMTYMVTGVLVGMAACITVAGGTSTLDQSVGRGQELAAIAAAVIGGASVLGGRGSTLGAVLGALLVQTVLSGVTQLGWPSQLANLFVGVFIIVAVGADLIQERQRRRGL